jgi:hypothetical protein
MLLVIASLNRPVHFGLALTSPLCRTLMSGFDLLAIIGIDPKYTLLVCSSRLFGLTSKSIRNITPPRLLPLMDAH